MGRRNTQTEAMFGAFNQATLKRVRERLAIPADARVIHYDQQQSPCGCYTHDLSGVPCTLSWYRLGGGRQKQASESVMLQCAVCGARWGYTR